MSATPSANATASARLNLPLIAPLQAQKQYSYNEAIAALDQLVQPTVISRTLADPPEAAEEGDTYIVAPGASGGWAGHAGDFACMLSDGWSYHTPAEGWMAYVVDDGELVLFTDDAWAPFSPAGDAPVMLGINASADSTNRLTVAAAATLLTHEGDDHRLMVNKAADTDTASLVFETDMEGRAEIGLAGDDDLHIKVSADGASWREAVSVARASGVVALPLGQLRFPAPQNPSGDAHTLDDYEEGTWTPQLNFGGAAVGMTFTTTPLGRYTKIGRTVFASGSFALLTKGSSVGAATITGLPYSSANDGVTGAASIGFASGVSLMSGAVIATIAPNTSRLALYQSASGSASALTSSNVGVNAQMVFSVVYDT